MASGPAKTADELSERMQSIVDRVLEADVRRQITRRGQEMAAMVADATGAASERAAEVWNDSRPQRRQAAKSIDRARRDATKWSSKTWQRDVEPTLRDLWKRRGLALTAAGAAVPAGRELVEDAAVRIGLRQRRERRHWSAFFLGMLLGAAAGAAIALLSAPKPGRQLRGELATRGREMADDVASRARETEWVPLFQRGESGSSRRTTTEGALVADDRLDPAGEEATPAAGETIDLTPEGEERQNP